MYILSVLYDILPCLFAGVYINHILYCGNADASVQCQELLYIEHSKLFGTIFPEIGLNVPRAVCSKYGDFRFKRSGEASVKNAVYYAFVQLLHHVVLVQLVGTVIESVVIAVVSCKLGNERMVGLVPLSHIFRNAVVPAAGLFIRFRYVYRKLVLSCNR